MRRTLFVLACFGLAASSGGTLQAQCRSSVRVDLTPAGVPGNGPVFGPLGLSDDGNVLVFTSRASDLVAGDTNGTWDVFRHERASGTLELVTVSTSGVQSSPSFEGFTYPCCSDDGRFVAFASYGDSLIGTDLNNRQDVFVRDALLGTTERVSQDCGAIGGHQNSDKPSISADGRLVSFVSSSSGIVFMDDNDSMDVFVADRQAGVLTIESRDSGGVLGNAPSTEGMLSRDGRFLVFSSSATNLVAGDTNLRVDIFLRELASGTTSLVSTTGSGALGDGHCLSPKVSADGSFVVFLSTSTNLIPGDTNQVRDLFRKDVQSGAVRRVNLAAGGAQPRLAVDQDFSLSADDRFVVFTTREALSGDDHDDTGDVYRHELSSGRTTLVTLDGFSAGEGRYTAAAGDAVFYVASGGAYLTRVEHPATVYCASGANWSGAAARMDTEGQADLGGPELFLVARGLPSSSALFLMGTARQQVPFGNGSRCVGGSVVTLGRPARPLGGVLRAVLDPALPRVAAIPPGATRQFQAWFRDRAAGGAGFDTSDGIELTFCP